MRTLNTRISRMGAGLEQIQGLKGSKEGLLHADGLFAGRGDV